MTGVMGMTGPVRTPKRRQKVGGAGAVLTWEERGAVLTWEERVRY
jgi:hypothetical protein